MKLYEIDEAILACIDTETGEIIDEARLDELEIEYNTKIENVGLWIKDLNAEAKAIKEEVDSLNGRRKVAENKANSLKEYLRYALDGQMFKTPKLSVYYRKSKSVNIISQGDIPEEYLKYAEPTVNKTEVKKAIEQGQVVPGAEIVENQSIQIK